MSLYMDERSALLAFAASLSGTLSKPVDKLIPHYKNWLRSIELLNHSMDAPLSDFRISVEFFELKVEIVFVSSVDMPWAIMSSGEDSFEFLSNWQELKPKNRRLQTIHKWMKELFSTM